MALIDSYAFSNYNTSNTLDNTYVAGIGQTMTGNGQAVGFARFWLNKVGTPAGDMVAKIYAISGTFGTNAIPTGAALATSVGVAATSLSVSPTFSSTTFVFSGANQIVLTNGTHYALTLEYVGTLSDRINAGKDTTSPTHNGNFCVFTSDVNTWSGSSGTDFLFELYDNIAVFNGNMLAMF